MSPPDEAARLEALQFYELLDTEPEDTFDIITSMLSEMLGVPHACISLVDRDRVWFKSTAGVEVREVARELRATPAGVFARKLYRNHYRPLLTS